MALAGSRIRWSKGHSRMRAVLTDLWPGLRTQPCACHCQGCQEFTRTLQRVREGWEGYMITFLELYLCNTSSLFSLPFYKEFMKNGISRYIYFG